VLQRAVFHVQSSGNTEVSGANVLVAIFSEQGPRPLLPEKAEITPGCGELPVPRVRKDNKPESGGNNAESDDGVSSAQIESFANLNQLVLEGASIRSSAVIRSSIAPFRYCAAAARTTPCWSGKPGWARPPSPKGLPTVSSRMCPR
jgi:hypothetical protein